MTTNELRRKFVNYFSNQEHIYLPPASLLSNDDPSVLFNVAGMQQFKPYYIDPAKAPSGRVITIQPCLRTIDIDEVGDDTHLTFFEMLGNFSFNDYFKTEAIAMSWKFLTDELKISKSRIHATYFSGDDDTPADIDSKQILKKITNLDDDKIIAQNREDNFWGPTGIEGPCGPTVEFYVDGIEIWNLVFNEFYKNQDGQYKTLEFKGVDTGMGLERLITVLQNKTTVYQTDLFTSIVEKINKLGINDICTTRIIADHLKAIVFLVSEGLEPKNLGREYVLRKLMRRVMMHELINSEIETIFKIIIAMYPDSKLYKYSNIKKVYTKELEIFQKTLKKGLLKLEEHVASQNKLDGKDAFMIYSTFGIPLEAQRDYISGSIEIDEAGFNHAFALALSQHKDISRAGLQAKFGGHGVSDEENIPDNITAEDLEKIKCNHTATHLLQQALRDVLGKHIAQKGSDVTAQRLRFDFSHPDSLTQAQKQAVEDIVNQKINEKLTVFSKTLTLEEAREVGALAFFNNKYKDKVKVYFIGSDDATAWSKELCGGPHVTNTSIIKNFKITSEKSSSAGIRRIKAITNF